MIFKLLTKGKPEHALARRLIQEKFALREREREAETKHQGAIMMS